MRIKLTIYSILLLVMISILLTSSLLHRMWLQNTNQLDLSFGVFGVLGVLVISYFYFQLRMMIYRNYLRNFVMAALCLVCLNSIVGPLMCLHTVMEAKDIISEIKEHKVYIASYKSAYLKSGIC